MKSAILTLALFVGTAFAADSAPQPFTYACTDTIACTSAIYPGHVGCYSPGTAFQSFQGGNNCSDMAAVHRQICAAGLDPLQLTFVCRTR